MTEFKVRQLKKPEGVKCLLKSEYFEADGSWVKPDNLVDDEVYITQIGGGGTGESSFAFNSSLTGGNSGEFEISTPVDISSVAVGESVAVTVGDGGNDTIRTGGISSFGSFVSVLGGSSGDINDSESGHRFAGSNKAGIVNSAATLVSEGIGAATWRAIDYNSGNVAPGGAGGLLGIGDKSTIDPSGYSAPTGSGYGAGSGGRFNSATENPARDGVVVVSYYVEV